MTFIFRNRTIFWDISKWNKGQKKWDGGSIIKCYRYISATKKKKKVLRFCLFVQKLKKEYPFLLFVDMGKRNVGAMYFP